MSFEEIKKQRTYIKIKGMDGNPALEVDLESLASLIQFFATMLSSGQIEIENREVTVKQYKPIKFDGDATFEPRR